MCMRFRCIILFVATRFGGNKNRFCAQAFAPPMRIGVRPTVVSRGMSSSYRAQSDEAVVRDMLYRIRRVNTVPNEVESKLLDFSVDGIRLGQVTHDTAELLVHTAPPVFEYKSCGEKKFLSLSKAAGTTYESRTAAVEEVMLALREKGVVTGWRSEHYPIQKSFYEEPVFSMERAAVPLLGALEYGVHINGLVKQKDGSMKMWMARRARDKSKYPGMLDHIVAGGQPVGMGLFDNVVKECMEEAGIPEELTRAGIQATGGISYRTATSKGDAITRAVMFCFDLELPPSFQPVPTDGEVEEFFLWSMDEVKDSMARDYPDPIKPNCYTVIIDYMLRSGNISPESPGYLDVLRELRSGDCY